MKWWKVAEQSNLWFCLLGCTRYSSSKTLNSKLSRVTTLLKAVEQEFDKVLRFFQCIFGTEIILIFYEFIWASLG